MLLCGSVMADQIADAVVPERGRQRRPARPCGIRISDHLPGRASYRYVHTCPLPSVMAVLLGRGAVDEHQLCGGSAAMISDRHAPFPAAS